MFGHIRSIIRYSSGCGNHRRKATVLRIPVQSRGGAGDKPEGDEYDSVYTMEQYLKTLKRNQTVYKYASSDEAEVDNDYGTYVVPGLKSTRTLKVKGTEKQKLPHP